MKHLEKKIYEYNTKMLHAILTKPWNQHLTEQRLYGHLLPISQSTQIRCERHAVYHCLTKDELISNFLQWTPKHGHANVDWPTKTYIHLQCTDIKWEKAKGIHDLDMSW